MQDPEVHPFNYVFQIFLFVWGASFFGYFVYVLQSQIKETGWVLNPRCLWAFCLCLSASFDVLRDLDPTSALGIFPPGWLNFLVFVGTSLLLNCAGCATYMYLVVLYKQHMSEVPSWLRTVWLTLNITLTIVNSITSLVGAGSNTIFWFGVGTWVTMLHELVIMILVNESLNRLTNILKKLPGSNASLERAIRKMRIIRVAATVICPAAIINQIISSENAFNRLAFDSIKTPDTADFDVMYWVPGILVCIAHSTFAWMIRRPKSKDQERLERINVTQSSESGRRPSTTTSRSSSPSNVASLSPSSSAIKISPSLSTILDTSSTSPTSNLLSV